MIYWEKPGSQNTIDTFRAVINKANEFNINSIVVASNTGETIKVLLGMNKKWENIICVTHQDGFKYPGINEMDSITKKKLEEYGVKILTTTHLFRGVNKAISTKYGGISPCQIMADTLRMFSEGMKVAIEISVMALDAGFINYNENIISVGGTSKGADTAIIVRPNYSDRIFDTIIEQIICMPKKIINKDKIKK